MRRLLAAPLEELYHVDEIEFDPPGMAEIRQSVPCESCGEPTMRPRLVERDGRLLCIPCSEGWKPPR